MLTAKSKLDERQLKAIDLLISKPYTGMTNKQIAEEVGVSAVSLYAWMKKPEFNDEFLAQSKELNRATVPSVFSYFSEVMEDRQGKYKDSTKLKVAELLLKNQGLLKDVQESTVKVDKSETVKKLMKSYGINKV